MKGRSDTTPPRHDTSTFENAADAAVLKESAAKIAAGEDPFGDDDGDETPAAASAPIATDPPVDPPAIDPPATDEVNEDPPSDAADDPPARDGTDAVKDPPAEPAATAPKTEEPAAEVREQPAVQFKTRTVQDIDKARADLLNKKAEAWKKYSDGTMTPEEFTAIDNEVLTGISNLAAESALALASAQAAQQVGERAIEVIKAASKAANLIDYDTDTVAVDLFNAQVNALALDPSSSKLSEAQFYSKAHEMVLAMRGLRASAAAPAPAPATKPPARQDMKPPITLRNAPAAATSNTGGGVAEQLSRLHGQDFEAAIGSMPKAQRDAWMDS